MKVWKPMRCKGCGQCLVSDAEEGTGLCEACQEGVRVLDEMLAWMREEMGDRRCGGCGKWLRKEEGCVECDEREAKVDTSGWSGLASGREWAERLRQEEGV